MSVVVGLAASKRISTLTRRCVLEDSPSSGDGDDA